MAIRLKGGQDGLDTFELAQGAALQLVAILTANSVSFYCEPWVDSWWHITVNGEAGDRVEKRLKSDKTLYRRLPRAKEA